MRHSYYFRVFFVLAILVVVFSAAMFLWDSFSPSLVHEKEVEIEFHRPRVFVKADRRVIQYNRIFYNHTSLQVVLREGRVCFFGGMQGDYCDGNAVDYLMGPSSYLVQTNKYLFLVEGVKEVVLEYKGEMGEEKKEVLVRIVLGVEGTKLLVKEGLPLSSAPLPEG